MKPKLYQRLANAFAVVAVIAAVLIDLLPAYTVALGYVAGISAIASLCLYLFQQWRLVKPDPCESDSKTEQETSPIHAQQRNIKTGTTWSQKPEDVVRFEEQYALLRNQFSHLQTHRSALEVRNMLRVYGLKGTGEGWASLLRLSRQIEQETPLAQQKLGALDMLVKPDDSREAVTLAPGTEVNIETESMVIHISRNGGVTIRPQQKSKTSRSESVAEPLVSPPEFTATRLRERTYH